MKRGIIQSRGLGDIIIALPIAHYYYTEHGDEIYWPICQEFIEHFQRHVPWVNWLPCIDKTGLFFYEEPTRLLAEVGVEDTLYLYQYLSSHPELTDPELFSILKFDQYKYWTGGVPFLRKWRLSECILRDVEAEEDLLASLGISGDYCVIHRSGSDYKWNEDISWLEDMQVIDIDSHPTRSIFDWIKVLEGCSVFIGVDSVIANLVDSMNLEIEDKYWIRRSGWDVTPVLGGTWTIIENEDVPVEDRTRVNPRMAADRKLNPPRSGYPTSFMSALKK